MSEPITQEDLDEAIAMIEHAPSGAPAAVAWWADYVAAAELVASVASGDREVQQFCEGSRGYSDGDGYCTYCNFKDPHRVPNHYYVSPIIGAAS